MTTVTIKFSSHFGQKKVDLIACRLLQVSEYQTASIVDDGIYMTFKTKRTIGEIAHELEWDGLVAGHDYFEVNFNFG